MMRHIAWTVMVGLTMLAGCAADPQDTPPVRSAAPRPLPETFQVKLVTSKGEIVIEVTPDWAPEGAARFRELVEEHFYDDCRFFRVLPNFMAQVGINGDPQVHAKWDTKTIPDDPVIRSNRRGMVTFAKTGAPNSRSTQFFINFSGNTSLDGQGFSPFGKVVSGMDVVDKITAEYRERPQQQRIQAEGNAYLAKDFPNLDYIKTATIISDTTKPSKAKTEEADPEDKPRAADG